MIPDGLDTVKLRELRKAMPHLGMGELGRELASLLDSHDAHRRLAVKFDVGDRVRVRKARPGDEMSGWVTLAAGMTVFVEDIQWRAGEWVCDVGPPPGQGSYRVIMSAADLSPIRQPIAGGKRKKSKRE